MGAGVLTLSLSAPGTIPALMLAPGPVATQAAVPVPVVMVPTIVDIAVSLITTTSVRITWTLDQPCTGQIEYGTTSAYGLTGPLESSFNYSTHIQSLTGLAPDTLYHFRVVGENSLGQTYQSGDQTFTTEALPTSPYPPVTNPLAIISQPSVALPAYLVPFIDQRSGSGVMRVTNTAGQLHIYSKKAAWNSDGTRLYIGVGGSFLLNTTTWASAGAVTALGEWTWSNVNPAKAYGMYYPTRLMWLNTTTNVATQIHDFAGDGYSAVRLGEGEGAISYNDDYINLHLRRTSDGRAVLGVYRISTNTLRTRVLSFNANGSGGNFFDLETNSQISPNGDVLVANFEGSNGASFEQGVWALDATQANLPNIRQLNQNGAHGDSGKDGSGNQIWAQVADSTVKTFRLVASAAFDLTLVSGSNAYWAGHVSMRNILLPGWVYASCFNGSLGTAGHHQVTAIKTDGSGDVRFFAHDHNSDPGSVYYAGPMACPNPDGTRVVFHSQWGASNIYEYVTGVGV